MKKFFTSYISSYDFKNPLDEMNRQDSPIFANLKKGYYTLNVRTKNCCIIRSENFSIFTVQNDFSLNGDDLNDT
ncbi:hypothetical protein [Chryseobacterium sp. MP_3.2]|uniref:hypothetical protein n=1 Tax=Chryseobacterium sp. MP_3.2 TaxID=3071712 RepID=UPI002DFC915A|nr:hypothetical protein [Chryseobacterium sp. MP_3.2]